MKKILSRVSAADDNRFNCGGAAKNRQYQSYLAGQRYNKCKIKNIRVSHLPDIVDMNIFAGKKTNDLLLSDQIPGLSFNPLEVPVRKKGQHFRAWPWDWGFSNCTKKID
jgi:hypothetical protein